MQFSTTILIIGLALIVILCVVVFVLLTRLVRLRKIIKKLEGEESGNSDRDWGDSEGVS